MDETNELLIEIEERLGWTCEQIHNAMAIIFDSSYAETQTHKTEYLVLNDKRIQELCFEYIDIIQ
jgi:hypothetical protein